MTSAIPDSVLYQLSYQANRELVILWVCNEFKTNTKAWLKRSKNVHFCIQHMSVLSTIRSSKWSLYQSCWCYFIVHLIPSQKLSLSITNDLISSLILHPAKRLLNPQVCVKIRNYGFLTYIFPSIFLCATKHINVLFFDFFLCSF